MAKEKLRITGTTNTEYDLDAISEENRTNNEKPLVVQVHTFRAGENPNPSNLQIGQIWVSKKIVENGD